jgi:hypothetical protein
MVQGQLDFGHHVVRQPLVAYSDDRLERMGQAAEVLFLTGGKWHLRYLDVANWQWFRGSGF